MTQVYIRKPHQYSSYFTISQFAGWQDESIELSDEIINRYLKNKAEFDLIQSHLESAFINKSTEKELLND